MSERSTSTKQDFKPVSSSEERFLTDEGYLINRQLGKGSYARVYLVTQIKGSSKANNTVACKVINTKMAPKEFTSKFLPRELDILNKINHPHIVSVFAIYHKLYNYFIFMKFAEIGDLLHYIVDKRELTENICRVWFYQLCSAIYYLHNLNIAHRDIKCENILITSNYNIKLADFGFSRYVVDNNGKPVLSNTHCGSMSYASPEILRGREYFPKTSDIWSLGIVLFIMLNKSKPFHVSNVKALYKLQLGRKWKFRTNVEPSLTKAVINLVTSLLEPDYRRRMAANELMKVKWFNEGDLFLTEEIKRSLNNKTKIRDGIFKKRSTAKIWRNDDDDEEDIVIVPKEVSPLLNVNMFLDSTGNSIMQMPRASIRERKTGEYSKVRRTDS